MASGEIHILPSKELYKNRTEDVEQVQNWIDEYLKNPAEVTNVVIAFEYLNSIVQQYLFLSLEDLIWFSCTQKSLLFNGIMRKMMKIC